LQKISGERTVTCVSLCVMEHVELLRTLTVAVRDAGPAAALDALRSARPALVPAKLDHAESGDSADLHDGYHETLATFWVWAVDRLVQAGLSDLAILWHPLTDHRSPLAWWDEATLASSAARESFVPSTSAAPWEPQPQSFATAGVLVAA
jgi:hypothetical protein